MGGTFDPVHVGHLRTALEVRDAVGADEISLVPCATPVHRAIPGATEAQRLDMLAAAIEGESGLAVDNRELERSGKSYTVDTLAQIRSELGAVPAIAFVMGADAFSKLDSWHEWKELCRYGHLIVIERPGWPVKCSETVTSYCSARWVHKPEALRTKPAGAILRLSLTPLAISSTQIRHLRQQNRSVRYLVPDNVNHKIIQYNLYRDSARCLESAKDVKNDGFVVDK